MEKIVILTKNAAQALETLKEIVKTPFSVIVRDAAIQRFENSFEIMWKLVKEYLRIQEGIICNSPKSCFREAFKAELLSEEESIKALEMTDDRNLTSHTYHEEVAEEIYNKIAEYYDLLNNLFLKIKRNRDCHSNR